MVGLGATVGVRFGVIVGIDVALCFGVDTAVGVITDKDVASVCCVFSVFPPSPQPQSINT
jgi:hypothetical protein